jgi:hypothetical protein
MINALSLGQRVTAPSPVVRGNRCSSDHDPAMAD